MRSFNAEFFKFVFFGLVNTLLSYVLYVLFLFAFTYTVSYTLSYVLGVFLSYYLNTQFVFQEKVRLTKMLQYPLVYLVQYLLGVALLYVLVEHFGMDARLVPVLIILITVPITFLLSRFIIKGWYAWGFVTQCRSPIDNARTSCKDSDSDNVGGG
jgi:putative flippase GtrA